MTSKKPPKLLAIMALAGLGLLLAAAALLVRSPEEGGLQPDGDVDGADLTLAWRLRDSEAWRRHPLSELPTQLDVTLGPLPEGDHEFRWTIAVGDDVRVDRRMVFAAATDLDARLGALQVAVLDHPQLVDSALLERLRELAHRPGRVAPVEAHPDPQLPAHLPDRNHPFS